MITKPSSGYVRQLLRIAAPPVLTLGALLVVGEVSPLGVWTTSLETSQRVAAVLAGLWLVLATGVEVHRTKRDAHAHQRLQQLRDAAQARGRALAHVEAVAWRSQAGQHAVVVHVGTGYRYRLWLPEADLPDGAYAVIEQRGVGVAVLDWVGRREVRAAHRHERRHPALEADADREVRQDARRLVEETEQFLKKQM